MTQQVDAVCQEEEMAKGKGKNNSSGKGDANFDVLLWDRNSLVPPQPRPLRSRKRECPSDEIAKSDDVQATLHQQDTERNDTAVDAPLLQHHQSPQDQHQAAEQSCLTKQDPATEEKHAETTNVSSKNVTVEAIEVQGETTVISPNTDSQLKGYRVHTDNNDGNQSGKDNEEITAEECNRSPSQTCTDHIQDLLPASEDSDGSCAAALEEQLAAKENSQCNLQRNQETSHEECSNVKEVTKEAAAGMPAKKRRRMGMCGLTEKERSHFLQTQKRENGQNGAERAEKQMWNSTADLVAQEEIMFAPPLPISPSIPAGSVTEQNEAETKLQSIHCGEDDRAQTEVSIAVTISDGTSTVCDPSFSKGKSEAEGDIVPASEQTGDTKSESPAEEEIFRNQEQQELRGLTAESMAEKPQEQIKDVEDGSAVADQSPPISFHSNPAQNEETEDQDAIEANPLQENNVSGTRDEKREELTCDSGDADGAEASSTDRPSGGFNCGSVELCAAAVSPGGSERKDSCDPDDEPGAGPSALNAVHPQPSDLFGSGYLDYVSDSQLNTIVLTEEEAVEGEEDHGSPDCHDATDLICGLIRELSSLNQKVMATHRELKNLRRSSKSLRSSIR